MQATGERLKEGVQKMYVPRDMVTPPLIVGLSGKLFASVAPRAVV